MIINRNLIVCFLLLLIVFPYACDKQNSKRTIQHIQSIPFNDAQIYPSHEQPDVNGQRNCIKLQTSLEVERSFRELKSTLDLRPIFHWSEPRVRGHVMICVLSYLLESLLRKKLKDQHMDCCFKDVMKDLQQIQAS